MKTILVPMDFSKCANNAMTYALEMAARTNATILALHVVFPNEGVDNNVYAAFWIDDYLKERSKALLKWAHKFRKNPAFEKLEIRTEVKIGFPVPVICETAAASKADVVVMGTTGATGLRGALLGSIAGGVMTHTPTPVVIVPKSGSFRTHANFVLAADFRMRLSDASRTVLKDLLKLQHSDLNVLHVMDSPEEQPDKTREAAVSRQLEGIKHAFHYMHDRNIAQAVSNYVESTEANGLVAVSHKHSLIHKLFYGSVSKALAHHIKVPMLVLHDADQ
jgi:nucleotide-binding universal stress UspA family protein